MQTMNSKSAVSGDTFGTGKQSGRPQVGGQLTMGTAWRTADQTKAVTWQCGTNSLISSSGGGAGQERGAVAAGAMR